MEEKKIYKRNGDLVNFDKSKISNAISKSIQDNEICLSDFLENITNDIYHELCFLFFDKQKIPNIEDIQNIVEEKLVESGNLHIAKSYILYRAERAKIRTQNRLNELEKLDKNLLQVVKRNGKKEVFLKSKLKKFWNKVSKGYEKTCPFEEVYKNFKITISDNISTDHIINNLIKSTIDMVSVENIDWQIIAGRIFTSDLYKQACINRGIEIKDIYNHKVFKDHFYKYLEKNLYSKKLKETYSENEILQAGEWINKDRDFDYIYSTVIAFKKRYLLNPNNVICELPQEMYLVIALFLAIPEKKEKRLELAKKIYEETSSQRISLPTPTLLNARTTFHQLSSCFKLNVDDDLRSIYHSIENMAQISKFGGGVGVYMGHVRSKSASIRNVKNASGGVVPWVKVINDTACAVNQLGSRLGAISPTLDIWHRDIHDFLEMQTETGDIRSKAFDIFPAVSVPDIFMKRVDKNEKWTLLDPHEVYQVTGKKIENLFNEDFEKFYLECENNENLELKEEVSAKELMKHVMKTAVETGMPYIFFRDTVNKFNPNKHVGNIYSTQLCTEICQNTKESIFVEEKIDSENISIKYKAGDTVVCNLASINVSKVFKEEELEETMEVAMNILDNVITLNLYPIKESEVTAKKYRSVGLGFMGLAEHLACNGLAYDSKDAREYTDQLFEKYCYYALKASNRLSKEKGSYELFSGSEWSKGNIIGKNKNWFKENSNTKLDWESLINSIKSDGLRFAYHFAPAPNTSTAGVTGTTAGLLPIYKKMFIETNVIAPTVTVAPNLNKSNFWLYKEYKNMDMNDVIDMISVIYKWVDQSISFEWMMDPSKTSPLELYNWYMKAWKQNIKTIYYLRSLSGEIKEDCISCSG